LNKYIRIYSTISDVEFVSRAIYEAVKPETAFHFCLIVIETLQVLLCGFYRDLWDGK